MEMKETICSQQPPVGSQYRQTVLVQSRLNPPALPNILVGRSRIQSRLALIPGHKLTLLTAPTGYGKTTAVLYWIQQQGLAAGWLTFLNGQDNLFTFVIYLVASLQRLCPGLCEKTEQLVHSGQVPESILLMTLVNELAGLPQPVVLVLDGYDHVADRSIHDFVAAWVEDLPATVRLVMTTRTKPPLPLSRWRVRRELAELQAADLCCDEAETAELVAAWSGLPVTAAAVRTIYARTEGWIAGVQLLALSLRSISSEQVVALLAQPNSACLEIDWLNEIFVGQPPDIQKFLLKTAGLDRFCASLCATVLADEEGRSPDVGASQAILERLLAGGLFLSVLDESGEWFRYHPLLADWLRSRQQIHQGMLKRLYRTAGCWFASRGLVEEAVQYLLASGQAGQAAAVVADYAQAALNLENWPQIERWLALFSDEVVAATPALLLARGWVLQFRFAFSALSDLLQQLAGLLEGGGAERCGDAAAMQGQLAVLNAVLCHYHGDLAAVLTYAEAGLDQIPGHARYVRGLACFLRAMALHALGRTVEAEGWLRDLLRSQAGQVDTFTLRGQFALATIYRLNGELAKKRELAQQMLFDAQAQKFYVAQGWAYAYLGYCAYESNELELAVSYYARGADLVFLAHTSAVRECLVGLALAQIALGNSVAAAAAEVRLASLLADKAADLQALSASLAMARGNLDAARRWAEGFVVNTAQPFLSWHQVPVLTAAWIEVAVGTPAGLQRSLALLHSTAQWARQQSCGWKVLECELLWALALQRLGEQLAEPTTCAEGQKLFADGVERALALGFRRLLLDLSAACPEVVHRWAEQYPALGRRVGTWLEWTTATVAEQPPAASEPAELQVPLLTDREREILVLLVEGKSNRQIGEKTHLSVYTVRNHLVHIYKKLGVSTRYGAVARCLKLKLGYPSASGKP